MTIENQIIVLSISAIYLFFSRKKQNFRLSAAGFAVISKVVVISILLSSILYVIRFYFFGFFYDTSKFTSISALSHYTLIFSPLFEESLFRGLLLCQLKRYLKTTIAVVVSSGLFTLLHKIPFYPDIMIFSLGLSYIYLRFGITTAITAHFLYNLILPFIITFVLRMVQ